MGNMRDVRSDAWGDRVIEAGTMIIVKGKKPDWLDRERGLTFPDFDALVVEVKPEDSLFQYCVMKADGRLWNIYEKHVIGVVA